MKTYLGLYQRKPAQIQIRDRALEFKWVSPSEPARDQRDESLFIEFRDLEIQMLGENNQIFILSSKIQPEERISTEDPSLIAELSRLGVKEATQVLGRAERRKRSRKTLFVALGLVLAFLLFGIPFLISSLPKDWIETLVPLQKEKILGKRFFEAEAISDPSSKPLHESVERLAQALIQKNPELASLPIRVGVKKSKDVNAFTLPGGYILMNSGLLEKSKSIEEVLGVLGHELGHVYHRHILKSLGQSLGFAAGGSLLSLIVGGDGATWLMSGEKLFSLKHSRDHEREADRAALRFLRAAGVSPKGLVEFFSHLPDASSKLGRVGRVTEIFSTHPVSEDRSQALSESVAREPYEASFQSPVSIEELHVQAKKP